MPMFNALQCYSCGMFQVKPEKRSSNQWCCCICNEKQSVREVFGRSALAKDVRKIVQGLNMRNQISAISCDGRYSDNKVSIEEQTVDDVSMVICKDSTTMKRNRWSEYLEEEVKPAFINKIAEADDRLVTVIPELQRGKRKAEALDKVAIRAGATQDCIQGLAENSQTKKSKSLNVTHGAGTEGSDLLSAGMSNMWRLVGEANYPGIQNNDKGYPLSRPLENINAQGSKGKTYIGGQSKWENYMDSSDDAYSEQENQPRQPVGLSLSSTKWLRQEQNFNISEIRTSYDEEDLCPSSL